MKELKEYDERVENRAWIEGELNAYLRDILTLVDEVRDYFDDKDYQEFIKNLKNELGE